MWWEEVELWVTCKRRDAYLLPPQKTEECVLIPSVNQSLAKQGLMIDRVVWERRELGWPAARLRFFSPHKSCQHSHVQFQKPDGVHLGYVVMQPVIQPAEGVEGRDTDPPQPSVDGNSSPTGPESGPESSSQSNSNPDWTTDYGDGLSSRQTEADPRTARGVPVQAPDLAASLAPQ